MNNICGQCKYTDGLIYTSLPSKVKCTITGEYHLQNDICNVEFKPVTKGEWIKTIGGNGWDDWYIYKCSECNKEFHRLTFVPNYCPNCGADMR